MGWDKGGTEPTDCGTGSVDHRLGTYFFVHRGKITLVRRVEFVGDKLSF
jgi:hypothetical protein